MDRRAFITLVGVSILAKPLAGEGQPAGKVYQVGYLDLGAPARGVSAPLRAALKELGYVEGHNLLLEPRFADAKTDQLPGLAKELVGLGVDVIVTIGTPTVQAAKDATKTIPIVMAGSADPVEHQLVA